jgi:two-component system, NarL family, sensor histidine kinase UhpB
VNDGSPEKPTEEAKRLAQHNEGFGTETADWYQSAELQQVREGGPRAHNDTALDLALPLSSSAFEELRSQVPSRILWAQEEEREQLARELHDGMCQSLSALLMVLAALELVPTSAEVQQRLDQIRKIAATAAKETRHLVRALGSGVLGDLGLVPALERHAADYRQTYGIPVHLHVLDRVQERLPQVVEIALYRIVQEALTNIARHAAAKEVSILLERRPSFVQVTVQDDGRGFTDSALPSGSESRGLPGLVKMRARAALLDGTLSIRTQPSAGTTVCARIPLPEAKHGED